MKLLRWLLFPVSAIYSWVSKIRNQFYDTGKYTSVKFDLPVISVGNLTVGGTGKTPHIEYLHRLLSAKGKVAILSRGYGRKTKGFRLANQEDTATTLGDEPMQYWQKFGPETVVAVGEERILAIPEIMGQHPETTCILLDDAFQHRKVRPSFSVLLCDFGRPFYTDYLLPTGNLRDNRQSAQRADVVVVSKTPADVSAETKKSITAQIKRYVRPEVPLFFSSISYGTPVNYEGEAFDASKPVLVACGLANPAPFIDYAKAHYKVKGTFTFKDHFSYAEKDLFQLMELAFASQANLLITEKDAVKWKPFAHLFKGKASVFYLPIEVVFPDKKEEHLFNSLVSKHVEGFNS